MRSTPDCCSRCPCLRSFPLQFLLLKDSYCLPPELMVKIFSYLPLEDASVLMIACARFWNSRTEGIFARVWKKLHPPPVGDEQKFHDSRLARFYTLRMLEYDGVFDGGYCCWGCMAIHQRTAFSCEELDQKVDLKANYVSRHNQNSVPGTTDGRFCLATKVCTLFGFCHGMSFLDMLDFRDSVRRRYPVICPFFNFYPVKLNGNVVATARYRLGSLTIGYRIPIAKAQDPSSVSGLVPFLQSVNFPLCTHICLADQVMLKVFESRNRWREFGHGPSTYCKRCWTKIVLLSGTDIQLYIEREVGFLDSPLDPTWLEHTYSCTDGHHAPYCASLVEWRATVQRPLDRQDDEPLPGPFEPDVPRPDFAALFAPVTKVKGARQRDMWW